MRAWCTTCRARSTVVDVSDEGGYDAGREWACTVEHLACGHHRATERATVGRGPGAPWAPGAVGTVAEATATRTVVDPWEVGV